MASAMASAMGSAASMWLCKYEAEGFKAHYRLVIACDMLFEL